MKNKGYLLGISMLGLLAGCGAETIFKTTTLPIKSPQCEHGGQLLEWGKDKDKDNILSESEVEGSSVSCNFPMLFTTTNLNANQRGCNEGGVLLTYGQDADLDGEIDIIVNESVHCNQDEFKVKTEEISPGANSDCEFGGVWLYFGTDLDNNDKLDANEYTKTQKLCQQRVDGYSNLIDVKNEEPGENCLSGGHKFRTGLDLNADLTLDPEEVLYTTYTCFGDTSLVSIETIAPGSVCETGGVMVHSGIDADVDDILDVSEREFSKEVCNGRSSISRIDSVQPGEVCFQGGFRLHTGFDLNASNVLDNNEITKTELICNGIDGLSTLMNLVDLPVDPSSSSCQFGGTRMQSGLDANRNGTLESGEVTHSKDVCKVQVNQEQNLIRFAPTYPEDGVCEFGGVISQVGQDLDNDRSLDSNEITSSVTMCNEMMIVDGRTTLSRTRTAGTSACSYGGFFLDTGIDLNRDGGLQTSEVTNTQLVCNGYDGYNTLTKTDSYTGSQCASNSGFKVSSGLDTDRDNILDSGEISKTVYVCHGQTGQVGLSALVKQSNYSGSNCGENGGIKVETGLDDNRNNVLDSSEVDSTKYVCDGLNGYDGADAIVKTSSSSSYYACGSGPGVKIESGTDLDYDGYLDSNEIYTTNYVCDGFDGLDGADGVNGYDGYDGSDAIVEMSYDTYSECDYGYGVEISAGTDFDGDGYLDSSEVNSSEVLCE